jgi:hypothetical protein
MTPTSNIQERWGEKRKPKLRRPEVSPKAVIELSKSPEWLSS